MLVWVCWQMELISKEINYLPEVVFPVPLLDLTDHLNKTEKF